MTTSQAGFTRHPILWEEPSFYDETLLDEEIRRVFDICHGCRRCFNLCDSFPRLFTLIDDSPSGELDTVESSGFKPVVDACTLCDMCFVAKCPYVPPHEFNLDFPHLMLRYRAVEHHKKMTSFADSQLTEMDRNGRLVTGILAPLVNWTTDRENTVARSLLKATAQIHPDAELPRFQPCTFLQEAEKNPLTPSQEAPAYGRKALLYITCSGNYNASSMARAAYQVLTRNGVEIEVFYPECCGMPQLEHGNLPRVAEKAQRIAQQMTSWVDKGYDIVALVPSCTLMLKQEWPLLLPQNEDIQRVKAATFDMSEYIVNIAQTEGLAPGLQSPDNEAIVHIACHARAQNIGQKAAEMLRYIPNLTVHVVERCSGHGGSWGIKKDNFEIALKVGKPVIKTILKQDPDSIIPTFSECPLAGVHIAQGIEKNKVEKNNPISPQIAHPIEYLAKAYSHKTEPTEY